MGSDSTALTPHLFVDISSHGFGHLAQTAPVLNALRAKLPDIQLTIRSGLPRERLALRIQGNFEHIPSASDFGLTMKSALDVDRAASLARYRAFHADWEPQVNEYAQLLAQHQPNWVLANISYLALAAAARARLPATALCSLNWAEIFYPYCADAPDAGPMREQMLAAYSSAEGFLRVTPGMDMPGLNNLIPIDPIARQGQHQRTQLHRALGLHGNARLVLVAMGGMPLRLSPMIWPRHPDLLWVVPQSAGLQRMDIISLESIDMDFSDLIASCDCVMTKSGYGTFVEAAAAGTPLLYVERRIGRKNHACWRGCINTAVRSASAASNSSMAILALRSGIWLAAHGHTIVPTGTSRLPSIRWHAYIPRKRQANSI